MKILLIEDNSYIASKIKAKLQNIIEVKEITTVPSGEEASLAFEKIKPDFAIMSPESAQLLNALKAENSHANISSAKRLHVTSRTHQGIQLLAISKIDFFQAEHKYVAAYHADGSLLIDDTLNSLEEEFPEIFIRIHRKTLVARAKIQSLERDDSGNWFLNLTSSKKKFPISRRQLPILRKSLKQHEK